MDEVTGLQSAIFSGRLQTWLTANLIAIYHFKYLKTDVVLMPSYHVPGNMFTSRDLPL